MILTAFDPAASYRRTTLRVFQQGTRAKLLEEYTGARPGAGLEIALIAAITQTRKLAKARCFESCPDLDLDPGLDLALHREPKITPS